MDLLAEAADYLQSQMERVAGTNVIYVRGEQRRSVLAIVGRTESEATDFNGFLVRSVNYDFTIRQDFFDRWTDDPKPIRNDKIEMALGGKVVVFSVNADALSVGHFRDSDGYGVAYRIHTKKD